MEQARFSLFGLLLAITLSMSCSPAPEEVVTAAPARNDTAAIRLVGADNMQTVISCWIDTFRAIEPDISVEYEATLSADGARAIVRRNAELSPFAREYFPAEIAEFKATFGVEPELVPVAVGSLSNVGKTHAIVVYVNRDNPLESLTLSDLGAIFASKETLVWGNLGLRAEWATQPVKTYGMINLRSSGNPPGIVNYLRHTLNEGKPLSDSIIQLAGGPERHALQEIVDAVAADRFAIGYSGLAFGSDGSKPLALAEMGGNPVSASDPTVSSMQYPLSRLVYMAVRPDIDGAARVGAAAFLGHILSSAGQSCITEDSTGFFPLPERLLLQSRRAARDSTRPKSKSFHGVGPTYVAKDGKVRVVGYNDMDRILVAVNERFRELHPEVEFDLDLRGTRIAQPALAHGESAFAPMGAEFSEPALREYRRSVGSDPVGIRVAHASLSPKALSGPLALFVHEANPLREISLDQAERLFAPRGDQEAITNWGQLGLKPPWAARPIQPCGLAPWTALAEFFLRRKLGARRFTDSFRAFEQSDMATAFAGDNQDAICFAAYNRRTPEVRALAVSQDGEHPAIGISPENIVSGAYPLDRFLYIYVRLSPDGGIDPLVKDYVRFVLSPTGQAVIGKSEREYLPLNAQEVQLELNMLSSYGNALPVSE